MAPTDPLALQTSEINAKASALNLTTGCLSLVKAIAESSVENSTIANAASIFYKWLARERVDERQLETWSQKSSALAVVNDAGLELLAGLKSRSIKLNAAGIPTVFPFSIGRALASKPTHQYLVTTVAIAMGFHDLPFAIDFVSNMIFDEGGHEHGVEYNHDDVRRALLQSVNDKVVRSIALNVVNAGVLQIELPPELQPCYHKRNLDAETLAAVVTAIHTNQISQSRAGGDLLLECDELYGDVTCWILHHFDGKFDVIVDNKNVFMRKLGTKSSSITMLVMRDPDAPHETVRPHEPFVRLSTGSGNARAGKFILNTEPPNTHKGGRSARIPLYDVSYTLPTMMAGSDRNSKNIPLLNDRECYSLNLVAQQIINWLLDIPLTHQSAATTGLSLAVSASMGVGFNAYLSAADAHDPQVKRKIGTLVSRWPGLARIGEGQSLSTTNVFQKRPRNRIASEHNPLVHILWDGRVKMPGDETRFGMEDIAECFPSLIDLLHMVARRCGCHACSNGIPLDSTRPGCLRNAVFTKLLVFIGHAIAECFGSTDASGLLKDTDLRVQVEQLLRELIRDKKIWWDTWFGVAASVQLGCDSPLKDRDSKRGAKEIVAVQYGSVVVAAKWANIQARSALEGLFAYEIVEGQIEGLLEDHAVVQTATTASYPADRKVPKPFDLSDEDPSFEPEMVTITESDTRDETNVSVRRFIFNAAGQLSYRLITIVDTSLHSRIINPADAPICLLRSSTAICNHLKRVAQGSEMNGSQGSQVSIEADTIFEWNFDDILGTWSSENAVKNRVRANHTAGITYTTQWLDTPLKQNVAMCLSPHGVTTRHLRQCCFACALAQVGGTKTHNRGLDNRLLNVL